MAKTKKWIAAAITGALLMSMLAGCTGTGETPAADENGTEAAQTGGDDAFVVAFSNANDADTFCAIRKDALIETVEADGNQIELQCADGMGDPAKQLSDIETFVTADVDVLIINPYDSEAVVPGIEAANEAGIPVILASVRANGGDFIYVGSRDYEAGYLQGEYLATTLPENATVCYLWGTSGAQHSVERHDGFLDALSEAGRDDVQILAELDGNFEMAKGMQYTEDWIQRFDHFDSIVAANDQMALGAIEALKGANRLEGVQVSGIDGLDEAIAAVKAGEMAQTVLQNAPGQAEALYDVAMQLKDGQEVEDEVMVPFESITAENVDEYL